MKQSARGSFFLAVKILLLLLFAGAVVIFNCMLIIDGGVFGWHIGSIYSGSGSMEPSISGGEMIISHRQPSYNKGDIIVFYDRSTLNEDGKMCLVTHRIAEKSNGAYITRGDANNVNDPDPVTNERIVGRVVYHSAFFGRIIERPLLVAAVSAVIIVLLALLVSLHPAKPAKK